MAAHSASLGSQGPEMVIFKRAAMRRLTARSAPWRLGGVVCIGEAVRDCGDIIIDWAFGHGTVSGY